MNAKKLSTAACRARSPSVRGTGVIFSKIAMGSSPVRAGSTFQAKVKKIQIWTTVAIPPAIAYLMNWTRWP